MLSNGMTAKMTDRTHLFNLLQRFSDELTAYHDYLSSVLSENSVNASDFLRKSLSLWKSKLATGDTFSIPCVISPVLGYAQSAGAVFDEILTNGNRPLHWLPVGNGCCKFNSPSIVETNAEHLTIVCELRDGYASIFVSPEGHTTWEIRKIDRESTFNLSYVRDILGVLSGQLDLSTDYMRTHGHFYSNCHETFKNISNHTYLSSAIPYDDSNHSAIYMDLSWDMLDVFLPLRDVFLHRRLPSLGLRNWLKKRFLNSSHLKELRDETIKSVLLRGQHRFEETSGLELDPDDLFEPLESYLEHVFHMVRDSKTVIHLSGWFGSLLMQKHIPTMPGNSLDFPPSGCLSTWHNLLCNL